MNNSLRVLSIAFALFFIMSVGCSKRDGFPTAEIKDYNGVPTLFVNGEPNAGMTYMTYNSQEKYFRQFGEIGVDLASFQTSANKNLYWDDPPVWVSRDSFDFSLLDEEMEMIVRANPKGWIVPRVYLWSPAWWDGENPGELMRYNDGAIERPMQHISDRKRKTSNPSWASVKWREDTALCLREMIRHIRSKPYGKRVIGYHIASGGTEEWFYWGAYEDYLVDYSAPQTEGFRGWLREKYGTDEALKKAWNNPDASLSTAAIPSFEERKSTGMMFFRNPRTERHVMDYYLFHSHLVANTIAYFGKVVKEATGYKQLYGAFYGYTLARYSCTDRGHLALGELLESPYVDFLTSPTEYAYRDIGRGYSDLRTEIKSLQLHNKLWFDENDYRTYLIPKTGWGWTDNFSDSRAHQVRQAASQIARASAAWWFDMGGGWYDSPEFLKVIEKLNDVAERNIFTDRRSAAEIALVVDEQSLAVVETDSNFTRQLLAAQRYEIGRLGAPVDYLLYGDIASAPPYKMYIFVSQFLYSPEAATIMRELRSRGAEALVWIYAPGFIREERADITGTREVTGINIDFVEQKERSRVRITDEGAVALYGLKAGTVYGETERPSGPVFFADDPEAEALGVIEPIGKPGLVRKYIDGMRVYYSAAPAIPASVLRCMAGDAGVHLYIGGFDDIYVNRSFLGIHTEKAGIRDLKFPEPTDVYDVMSDEQLASAVVDLRVNLPARHTALYFLGSEEEWRSLKAGR